ncbi:hypothetical protein ACJIZ3_015036 [Penstemon smallii]|uniref:Uncharacterized protein n=1 Tax=Penstemon smallii TaxID=265156 RepID=A0ABD3RLF8_9LAMI
MASKTVLLVLVSVLLINTKVSSEWEEYMLVEDDALAPAESPIYKSSPSPAPSPDPDVNAPPSPLPSPSPTRPPRNILECFRPCLVRCKFDSRKNVCLWNCLTCCDRCKCVPPGQYGNKEKCGKCYTDMTTRNGRPKCP